MSDPVGGDEVEMLAQAPTVESVQDRLQNDLPPLGCETAGRAVLHELVFCMKTVTRLGRTVLLEGSELVLMWGHKHGPGWAAAHAVRDADGPEDLDGVDLDAVVFVEDLVQSVASRAGFPEKLVSGIVGEFFEQVEELEDMGVSVNTMTERIGYESEIEDELVEDLSVLESKGYDLTLHKQQMHLGDAGRADVVARTPQGDWLVIELKRAGAGAEVVDQLTRYLDAIEADHAEGAEVEGLVLSDGDSTDFLDRVGDDGRVSHLNVRSMRLPLCRAQKWLIEGAEGEEGYLYLAADGITVVDGGGPAFPEVALAQPFRALPLDWTKYRIRPLAVGSRQPFDDDVWLIQRCPLCARTWEVDETVTYFEKDGTYRPCVACGLAKAGPPRP